MSALGLASVIVLVGLVGFFGCQAKARNLEKCGRKMHSRPAYYGVWAFFVIVVPALLFLFLWWQGGEFYLNRQADAALASQNCGSAYGDSAAVNNAAANGENAVEENSLRSGDKAANEALSKAKLRNRASAGEISAVSLNLERAVLKYLVKALPVLGDNFADYAHFDYADVQKKLLQEKGIALVSGGSNALLPIAVQWLNTQNTLNKTGAVIALILALCGLFYAFRAVKPGTRARNRVERLIVWTLFLASLLAIATTIAIILSMLFQTLHFFEFVPMKDFFFGTVWNPRFSAAGGQAGQFGLIPLLFGTLYIAAIAMLVAVPVGLFSAVYMAEYASAGTRSLLKPLLEILAGIPTIVYGFFALMTVGPLLRDISAALAGGQAFIQAQSVLTAGFVMGIMLIPFVSSLSDDIITAVPRALRDGSYGLGATQSETVKKVVLPAALPGIVAALLLAASRAVGETMIVVLAAGAAANITFNPFEPMTAITVKIVNQLTGDLEFNSPQTLVAFALGMTLFVLTLLMNIFALYITRKYREQYE